MKNPPMKSLAQFEILERLGHGGMGVVYKARDTRLGRTVAIKVLPAMASSDPERRHWLLREARAAAALNHPAIATIYEVGEASIEEMAFLDSGFSELSNPPAALGPIPYIVMEHVDGEDLKARLERGPLAVDDVVRIGRQIARGLAAAHRAGIVHRDLKPGNVMLTPEGNAKLLDFSLAKFVRPQPEKEAEDGIGEVDFAADSLMTSEGMIIGTVPYMAPEQLEGVRVDKRSDLFSLGVLLYEMTTGTPPFPARGPVDYFRALEKEPPTLTSVQPEVPEALERVVHRLLAWSAEERYAEAQAVADELSTANEKATYGEDTVTIVLPRWRPSRRARAFIVLILVVVIASPFVVNWWRSQRNVPVINLAVLPFENQTGDANHDYLGLGMSQALISQLRRVRGINALPSELGVERVLAGKVRREDRRIVVEVELQAAPGGGLLWQRKYDYGREEVHQLQTGLAMDLVQELDIPLSWAEYWRLRRPPTSSPEAFFGYLQAQPLIDQGDSFSLYQAAQRLRTAIAEDAEFTLARVDLSLVLFQLYTEVEIGNSELLAQAEEQARRAVELDPQQPEARIVLAQVYRGSDQHLKAIDILREVVWRYPHLDEAHWQLALTYRQVGQLCEARLSAEQATRIRPRFWRNWDELSLICYYLGDLEGALAACSKATELAPPESRPWSNLVGLQVATGDYEKALENLPRLKLPVSSSGMASNLGFAFYATGRLEQAESYFKRAVELADRDAGAGLQAMSRQNLGDLMQRTGRSPRARELYREALERLGDPASSPAAGLSRLRRILLLAKVEDCERVAEEGRRAEHEVAASVEKFRLLAMSYALCGERRAALAAVERAVEHGALEKLLRENEELAALRDDPEFLRILETTKRKDPCAE